MSKILVLVGSARRNGNTDILAKSFATGARENNEVEILYISKYKIHPCKGCNACQKNELYQCIQKDKMSIIYGKLMLADILIIASPVYFYGISAQLKALIDRLHNPLRNYFSIRKLGLILVGADVIPELFDSIIVQYELILKFFGLQDVGRVLVRGAKNKGDVYKTEGIKEAYELGANIKS